MTADECRRLREACGLTPERLATIAGLAVRTVLRFEAASVAPRAGTTTALRRAFRTLGQELQQIA